jgi:addiction module RelE/StbE family toxin
MPRWTRKAEKDLEDVPESLRRKINSVVERLDSEPLMGKKLKGKLSDRRSVPVARSYRILYSIDERGPIVLAITLRKDAYR